VTGVTQRVPAVHNRKPKWTRDDYLVLVVALLIVAVLALIDVLTGEPHVWTRENWR
jgi:hypothetical protein